MSGLQTTFILQSVRWFWVFSLVYWSRGCALCTRLQANKAQCTAALRQCTVKLYLTIIRGTPVMVQLLLMGFVITAPKLGSIETTWCAILTFGINSGAYVAKSVRQASCRWTK